MKQRPTLLLAARRGSGGIVKLGTRKRRKTKESGSWGRAREEREGGTGGMGKEENKT